MKSHHQQKQHQHQRQPSISASAAVAAAKIAATVPVPTVGKSKANGRGKGNNNSATAASSSPSSSATSTTCWIHPSSDPLLAVRSRAKSREEHIRQANLVLAAVTELLREQGVAPNAPMSTVATAYFGALMVALEQGQQHNAATIGGLLYLLAIVFRQVPDTVLRVKFEPVSIILIALLEKYADNTAIIRPILLCAGHLLTTVDSTSAWMHKSPVRMLQALFVYSLDHRPKVRRQSQISVASLLFRLAERTSSSSSSSSGDVDMAATQSPAQATALGIPKTVLDAFVSFCKREIDQATAKETNEIMYMCGLLQSVLPIVPPFAAGTILESLLATPTRTNATVLVQIARAVQAMSRARTDVFTDKQQHTYVELLDRLIDAWPQSRPHIADVDATTAFVHAIPHLFKRAHAESSMARPYRALPAYLDGVFKELMLSPKAAVVSATTDACIAVLSTCFTDTFVRGALASEDESHEAFAALRAIESLLTYRYKNVWHHVLSICRTVFEACPFVYASAASASSSLATSSFALVLPLLRTVDTLRRSDELAQQFSRSLDNVFAAAVAKFGPEAVLGAMPLELPLDGSDVATLNESLTRSRQWLLPIFKEHVRCARLGFFVEHFFPIARRLAELETLCVQNGAVTQGRAFDLLKHQVWDLLPAFCTLPTDVRVDFTVGAQLMHECLSAPEFAFAHPIICRAVATLIGKYQAVIEATRQRDESEAAREDEDIKLARAALDEQDREGSSASDEHDDEEDDEDEQDDGENDQRSTKGKKLTTAMTESTAESAAIFAASAALLQLMSAEDATASIQAIAAFSKDLLPKFFNLIRAHTDHREWVLSAITHYCSISDAKTLNMAFANVRARLVNALAVSAVRALHKRAAGVGAGAAGGPASGKKSAIATADSSKSQPSTDDDAALDLCDIALAMTSSLDADNLTLLYRTLAEPLRAEDLFALKDGDLFKEVVQAAEVPVDAALVVEHTKAIEMHTAAIKQATAAASASTVNAKTAKALKAAITEHKTAMKQRKIALDEHRVNSLLKALSVLAPRDATAEQKVQALCTALVAQIHEPALHSSNGLLQKKVYKIIAALCRHQLTFVAAHWQDMVRALMEASTKLSGAAQKTRVACLKSLLTLIPDLLTQQPFDANKLVPATSPAPLLTVLPSFLVEILLALKDPAQKTRAAAYELVVQLAKNMRAVDERIAAGAIHPALVHSWGLTSLRSTAIAAAQAPLFSEYMVMLMGGLAGGTPQMQSASLMAFGHLLFTFRSTIPPPLLTSMFSTFLPLLQTKSREVKKSMMGLMKVFSLSLSPDVLRPYLGEMIAGMGQWGEDKKNRFREKIRTILDILVRRCGDEQVRAAMPAVHHKLLDHIQKTKAREQRLRQEARTQRLQGKRDTSHLADISVPTSSDNIEQELYGSDADEEGEEGQRGGKPAAAGRPIARARRLPEKSAVKDVRLHDDATDLLDDDAMRTAVSNRSGPLMGARRMADDGEDGDVPMTADGKLILFGKHGSLAKSRGGAGDDDSDEDDDSDDDGSDDDRSDDDDDDDEDDNMDQGKKGKGRLKPQQPLQASGKRNREAMKATSGGAGANAGAGANRPAKRVQVPGHQYASSRGAGDSQKRGQKHQPHAFLPLNPIALNRRHKLQERKKLEGLVRAGKPGAAGVRQEGGGADGGAAEQQKPRFKGIKRQPKKHKK